jgi:pilus assembly protein FimV
VRIGRKGWLVAAGIAVVNTAAVRASESEPALQLSYELTQKSMLDPNGAERTLLRLEWKAAQSAVDEAAAVGELVGRVQRMSDACAELRTVLLSMPAPPGAIAAPNPPLAEAHHEALVEPAANSTDDPQAWLRTVGGGGIAALAGLWWLARRQPRTAKISETVPTSTLVLPLSPDDSSHRQQLPQRAESADLESSPLEANPDGEQTLDEGELSLKLADIMLSMGLTQSAARELEQHVGTHPRQALYHWLKLLDIYRQAGLRAEFDQASDRLCRQFNIAPPDWLPEDSSAPDLGLEHYPHIVQHLVSLWPDAECGAYLQHLLEDNRDGTRAGFPQSVAEDIVLLLSMLRGNQTGLSTSTN